MTNTIDHACEGITCSVCIEAERVAADRRHEEFQVKRFAAKKRGRSVAVIAAAKHEADVAKEVTAHCPACNGPTIHRITPTGPVCVPCLYKPKNETHWMPVDSAGNPPSTAALERMFGPEDEDEGEPEEPVSMIGNLASAAIALSFITAGNAYFTVRSQKSGVRYTYRVSLAKPQPGYEHWTGHSYFVALLTGPENTADYQYLGMIRDNVFRLTRASKMNNTATPVKAFRWVWDHLIRRELPPQTELWHQGRCGRCGRTLTVPESIAAGIGPECAGKMEAL